MQRHSGGGMAARSIACLPALVGAWRDAAGGIVLTTADFYGLNHKALERPDMIWNAPRTINQSKLGEALVGADPPVKAVYVYNNNPVAVCPDSNKVIAGFSRADLFTASKIFTGLRLRRYPASDDALSASTSTNHAGI
jgi:anaerobic selenocysteine-containing dehydrogenase